MKPFLSINTPNLLYRCFGDCVNPCKDFFSRHRDLQPEPKLEAIPKPIDTQKKKKLVWGGGGEFRDIPDNSRMGHGLNHGT